MILQRLTETVTTQNMHKQYNHLIPEKAVIELTTVTYVGKK